jgi:hypothetical protein
LQVLAHPEQQKQIEYYTEMMKKNGPRETTYAVLFAKEDYETMLKFTKKYPRSAFPIFEKKFNDHNTIVEVDGKKVELISISKAEDVPTFPGLAYCMRLILGSSTTRYQYMCVGSDGRMADPFKQTLYAEAASRLNITTFGSIIRIIGPPGAMQYLCTFASTFQTITVRESAINTVSTINTGIQLNRNSFPSNPIVHTSGGTSFIIGSQFTFIAREY